MNQRITGIGGLIADERNRVSFNLTVWMWSKIISVLETLGVLEEAAP